MKFPANNRVWRCIYGLVFALCSSIAVAQAGASKDICDFPDRAVTDKGDVLPRFGKALDFYQARVREHSAIDYATMPKPFDFSVHARPCMRPCDFIMPRRRGRMLLAISS